MLMEANADPELEMQVTKDHLIRLLESVDRKAFKYSIRQIQDSEQVLYSLSAQDLCLYFNRYEAYEYIHDTLHPRFF